MSHSIQTALPQTLPLPPVSRVLMGLTVKVARWEMNRRTRNALQKLDDHLLHDVGLTARQAETEWDKPFWWG